MIHATLTAQHNHQKRTVRLDTLHALTTTVKTPSGSIVTRTTAATKHQPDLVTIMLQSPTSTAYLYHGTLGHYQPREPRIHITVKAGCVQAVTVNGEECAYSLTDFDGTDEDDRIDADVAEYQPSNPLAPDAAMLERMRQQQEEQDYYLDAKRNPKRRKYSTQTWLEQAMHPRRTP